MSTTWWSETRFREVGGLSLSCHRTWEFTILIPSPIAINTRIITLIPSNFEICGCICVKILFEQMQNKLREIMANPSLCKTFTDQISQNSGASHPSKFQVSQGSTGKKVSLKMCSCFFHLFPNQNGYFGPWHNYIHYALLQSPCSTSVDHDFSYVDPYLG